MFKKEMLYYKKEQRFPKFKKFLGLQTIGLHSEAQQANAIKKLKNRLVPIREK